MLESIMYFAIGFLGAALVGLAIVPRVHHRAVRLTTRRLEAALPPSIAEVQAEKDLQRAEFAITTRQLEMTVERLNDKYTSQVTELGRTGSALGRLKAERNAQQAEIIALKLQVEALTERLASAGRDAAMALAHAGRSESARRPLPNVQRHDGDMASLVPETWPSDAPSREGEREEHGFASGPRTAGPSIQVRPRDRIAGNAASFGRRAFRAVARACIAVVIGAGATVAWQYQGTEVKELVATWRPALDRLLTVSTAKTSPPEPAPIVVATSSEPVQPPAPANEPADRNRDVDQPAAGQGSGQAAGQTAAQVAAQGAGQAQSAAVKEQQPAAAEEPAARQAAAPPAVVGARSAPEQTRERLTPYPETRPTTIAGWRLREVTNGVAVVEGPNGVWRVARGDTVPGVGKVESIVRWGGRWLVATSGGLISTP